MASQHHRNLARCPRGGKRRFRDQLEAVAALHSAQVARQYAAASSVATTRHECRAYRCSVCRGWHLTSQATRRGSAELVEVG